jgi:hypothetical protein
LNYVDIQMKIKKRSKKRKTLYRLVWTNSPSARRRGSATRPA